MTAALVVAVVSAAYLLVVAVYLWLRRGADRVDQLLDGRPSEPVDGWPVSVLAVMNPRYRFSRFSADQQFVTHEPAPPSGARSR